MRLIGRLLVICALAVGLAPAAEAAEILEIGDTYHVIAYEAGEGTAGLVVMRVEYPVIVSGQAKVRLTLADILPAPGWSYAVRRAGGINDSIEVDFRSAACSARFRASYKPGKTVVDGGRLNCR